MGVLIASVMIHALAGNLGTLYSTFKDTKGALFSSLCGAIVNICLNLILIPRYSIIGAAVATLMGYVSTFIYRAIDVRKFIRIKYRIKETILFLVLIIIQMLMYQIEGIYSYVIRLIIFLLMLIYKKDLLIRIIKK